MYIYLTPSVRWNRTFVGGAEIRKLQEKTKTTMMRSHKYMDCKTVVFILKISKEIGKVWFKSLTCAKGEKAREKKTDCQRLSPVSLSVFSLVPDLFFDLRAYLNKQKYGLFCSLLQV